MKLALAGTLALVVIAGLFAAWHFFGPGRATVVAPKRAAVRVFIDGALADDVGPGQMKHFALWRGARNVKVGEAAYSLQVESGGDDLVLPAPGQCFAVFDVLGAAYTKANVAEAMQTPIKVLERHEAGKPFAARAGLYFQLKELPPEIPADDKVELLREVPCEVLGGGDELLEPYAFAPD